MKKNKIKLAVRYRNRYAECPDKTNYNNITNFKCPHLWRLLYATGIQLHPMKKNIDIVHCSRTFLQTLFFHNLKN